jgi:hypothetical protein
MTSILKVDTIQDQSGNNIINENADTITIGASGDTVTIPSGASLTVPNGGLTGQNYPAFEARLGSDQGISNNTNTKITFDSEYFDEGSCYDNSTNYRFTPTKAGKYYCYSTVRIATGNANLLNSVILSFYKNGTNFPGNNRPFWRTDSNPWRDITCRIGNTIEFNGSSDYLEVFTEVLQASGTPTLAEDSSFGAYRIGS